MKPPANPIQLKPLYEKEGLLQVIVETPAGSRNKFAWDHEQGIFTLRRILPAGMAFPYDFGFLPQTKGGDGDPIDVLLLMDEPAFPGCAVRARLIGVIEAEQVENGERMRNDRLVAVAEASHLYAMVNRLDDLPASWIEELQVFFVNYQRIEGKEYRLLGARGPEAALDLIRQAIKEARKAA